MNFKTVTTPTLLLDADRCKANIQRLITKTKSQNVSLRPHFKTHQSRAIGEWFRESGIDKITVSSVGMARYFADAGWNDITIAFPVNVRQIQDIKGLCQQTKLGLLVLDSDSVEILGNKLSKEVGLWIKIDVGTHRTGIDPNETERIDNILEVIQTYPHLRFMGFLAHAGHSYHSRSVTEVQRIYDHSLVTLLDLKRTYVSKYPDLKISLGDTPGSSMVSQFGSVDELRPGNFVFYDLMQEEIGACTLDDIAVALACPVVAVHPERKQWIIYGGGIHFSKDHLILEGGVRCYGRMADITETSWSVSKIKTNPYIISLSQEHGVVQCDEHTFHAHKPGDLSLWLPVHSCMTADCLGEYLTTDGTPLDHYRKHVNPF